MIARLIISTSLDKRVEEINKILKQSDLPLNHPDLLYFSSDSKLGIAEARKIKDHFSYKSFNKQIKAVILEDAANLTIEAQNALLKTLEELPQDGLFILGADSDARILPTVVSRCEILTIQNSEFRIQNEKFPENIEEFLKSTLEEKFEYIERLKDKEEFLHFIVMYFHQKLSEPDTHERRRLVNLKIFLQELLEAEKMANQNVNIRALLEFLMLKMPKQDEL